MWGLFFLLDISLVLFVFDPRRCLKTSAYSILNEMENICDDQSGLEAPRTLELLSVQLLI